MQSRAQALAQAVGSARLEGMQPGADTTRRLEAWARGELSDKELLDDAQRMIAEARVRAGARDAPDS